MHETLPRWDLSDLYPHTDSHELHQDLEGAVSRSEALAGAYKGRLHTLSANELAEAISEYEAIEDIVGRLMSYAYLQYSCHLNDETTVKFFQDMSEKVNTISKVSLFFALEINKLDDVQLEQHIKESKALAHYIPWIRDVRVFKKYQLSDSIEEVLHEKALTSRQAWNRFFDESLAGLFFPYKDQILTGSEIFDLLSSAHPDKRENAARSISETLSDNIKTFAFITNMLAKDKEIEDSLRNYSRPISSRNVSNFIEDDIVDTLINSVKSNYPALSHRYYQLKAQWFNKEQLPYWDRNAPLPKQEEQYIPWKVAKDVVLTAYDEFSPQLSIIGEQFFEEGWIDADVYPGKESGAFSHPTVPSAHPYILLNYQGKIRDVMTLAHELGHGIHQMLSGSQGALMADTPLTLAETASVFGEQLTFRSLLSQQTDSYQRKIMIANKVEDMLNTVVRQVAFCEFERMIHDERRKGEIPTERIHEIWMQVQSESLGPAIALDNSYKVFWSYIPHFIHSPFYVYSYAFGDCLVNSLYMVYQDQPNGFAEKYIEMLRAGGTKWHKELLVPFGLDISEPSFWQRGLSMIAGLIDELEEGERRAA